MADQARETRGTRRPLWLWIGIALAAVIVIALIIASIVAGNAAPSASPTSTPGASSPAPSPTAADSGSPAPTDSPEPSPSATPTGGPDAGPTPRPTRKPVDIDETARVEKGVGVRLTSIKAIEGEVNVPGEEAGPALLITVEAFNRTRDDISTPAVIVNVYYGDDEKPAGILTRPRTDFPPVLEAGATESGRFAFTVPTDQRDRVRIEVDLSVGSPVVLFEGSVS